MLKCLQSAYAGEPVRFLLFPCNQFDSQEPGSNAAVKEFAASYVDLSAGSNVMLFAKSSLNHQDCSGGGANDCAATSVNCCPQNTPIYDFLQDDLDAKPRTIQWNFDKIIVNPEGHAVQHLHGGDTVDDAIHAASNSQIPLKHCKRGETQVCVIYTSGKYINWCSMLPFAVGLVLVLFGACICCCVRCLRGRSKKAQGRETEYTLLD